LDTDGIFAFGKGKRSIEAMAISTEDDVGAGALKLNSEVTEFFYPSRRGNDKALFLLC
jgi:hypothetical protein